MTARQQKALDILTQARRPITAREAHRRGLGLTVQGAGLVLSELMRLGLVRHWRRSTGKAPPARYELIR